jgi:hypothetical protein
MPPPSGIAFVDRAAAAATVAGGLPATVARQPVAVQAKLRVGNADHPAEREADAVAGAVLASLRRHDDRPGAGGAERIASSLPPRLRRTATPVGPGAVPVVGHQGGEIGEKQWYHKLKLNSWLRGIVRDARDQLTTARFPGIPGNQQVEGYGALGNRMDVDVTTGLNLPVFELRSPTGQSTYLNARQWALDLFDYIVSLNANPGGGYTRIV